MSKAEEPELHTVKKVMDDDAASALMALASTAEKKAGEAPEDEAADVPKQPAAVCTSPATPRSPTISTKFPSKVSGIY